jgi:hypothetical protein
MKRQQYRAVACNTALPFGIGRGASLRSSTVRFP